MTFRLPDRQQFRRGEVETITRLEGRVLDFWEREFDAIRPQAGPSGEKIYSRQDVKILLRIKEWLIHERIGKDEVRKRLAAESTQEPSPRKLNTAGTEKESLLGEARSVLADILTILQKDDTN